MIVVLEGPDCSGKSTLARDLAAKFDASVIVANGAPPKDEVLVEHYAAQITEATSAPRRLTVFDRLHVGELLYGPAFRGTARLSRDDVRRLENQLDAADAFKIHVDCSDQVLGQRFKERGDDMIRGVDELLGFARGYRDLFAPNGMMQGWTTVRTDEGALNLVELLSH